MQKSMGNKESGGMKKGESMREELVRRSSSEYQREVYVS
jgi:hypothetical protein